ncbi:C40 family peptidase [Corynebacterium sp. YSMAA1_1_F7]|uniref:C40 family peptidase n=1 Tax=Corynebacterium sp. YSMAA1_1_F7 TaxID=3383590 RepID=UPI0038D04A3C
MGKHSLKKNNAPRNAAMIAAVGVGAAVLNPAAVQAAPVTHTPSGFTVEVPDHLLPTIKPYFKQANLTVEERAKAPAKAAVKPAAKKAKKASSSSVGQRIANIAKSKVGAPYSWGASGPNAFDCSGLTSWAHRQVGKSIPRTSSAQASAGKKVSLNALQPGDVISYYGGASHVAIYIGGGKIVHALNSSNPVRIDNLHMMPVYNAVRF